MAIVVAIGIWIAVAFTVCLGVGKFIRAGARDVIDLDVERL